MLATAFTLGVTACGWWFTSLGDKYP